MEKRYQVFVSSTYADLKEERQHVIQALMEMDCIPAGMEIFPAADEGQFEFIKRVIDDCDYYLLIIGGRYGSVTADGVSYTEQEYDYALKQGLKIIAFIHENPDDIPVSKSDIDHEIRERLHKFRDKVSSNRLVRFWNKAEELPGLVAVSLQKTINKFPAVGWVKANAVTNTLTEIDELRKENASLRARISKIEVGQAKAKKYVLLVDDKLAFAEAFCDTYASFFKRRNLTVEIKGNVTSARAFLRKHGQDVGLAIIDIKLPTTMKGTNLLSHIKKKYPFIRRIAATAIAERGEVGAMAAEQLFHGYIDKDWCAIDEDRVKAEIKRVLAVPMDSAIHSGIVGAIEKWMDQDPKIGKDKLQFL